MKNYFRNYVKKEILNFRKRKEEKEREGEEDGDEEEEEGGMSKRKKKRKERNPYKPFSKVRIIQKKDRYENM